MSSSDPNGAERAVSWDQLTFPGVCEQCGVALRTRVRGRRRRFCSDRCRQRAHRVQLARRARALLS